MSFRIPVGVQEPLSTRETPSTFATRRLITARYVLAGNNLSVTYVVPSGRYYRFKHAYVQVNTTAGGVTVRQVLFGVWTPTPTQYGGASTNILAVASSSFTDNKNHLIMFVPAGAQAMNTAVGDTYMREQVNVPVVDLQNGDWFRFDVFECTAGDIVTVVITVEETSYT